MTAACVAVALATPSWSRAISPSAQTPGVPGAGEASNALRASLNRTTKALEIQFLTNQTAEMSLKTWFEERAEMTRLSRGSAGFQRGALPGKSVQHLGIALGAMHSAGVPCAPRAPASAQLHGWGSQPWQRQAFSFDCLYNGLLGLGTGTSHSFGAERASAVRRARSNERTRLRGGKVRVTKHRARRVLCCWPRPGCGCC